MTDSKKPKAETEQQMPAMLPSKKPKPKKVAPLASPPPGLDWERIRTDFEAVYNPEKSRQVAGRQIARIVVLALIELVQQEKNK